MRTMTPAVDELTTLAAIRPGDAVRVYTLNGGQTFVGRLAALGFTPGALLRVLQNFGRGPLIVLVRETRVALGRGEASRVVVRPLEGSEHGDAA